MWFVVVFWWSPGELVWVCVTWNWKLWLVCDLVVVYCFFLLHNRIQVYTLVQLSIYDINVFWFFWLDWACLLVCWLCFIFKWSLSVVGQILCYLRLVCCSYLIIFIFIYVLGTISLPCWLLIFLCMYWFLENSFCQLHMILGNSLWTVSMTWGFMFWRIHLFCLILIDRWILLIVCVLYVRICLFANCVKIVNWSYS